MSINVQAMERAGYGRELALMAADGWRVVLDHGDGEMPAALFGRVTDDGAIEIIHGMDWPHREENMLIIPADDFEVFCSTLMGMFMEHRRGEVREDAE
jgi:hypothetical protein